MNFVDKVRLIIDMHGYVTICVGVYINAWTKYDYSSNVRGYNMIYMGIEMQTKYLYSSNTRNYVRALKCEDTLVPRHLFRDAWIRHVLCRCD